MNNFRKEVPIDNNNTADKIWFENAKGTWSPGLRAFHGGNWTIEFCPDDGKRICVIPIEEPAD
jgi:hypothetical protein